MRKYFAACAALLWVCAASFAWAAGDPVARVLTDSGLIEEFSGWEALALSEVELRRSAMSAQEYQRTLDIMRQAFDSGALQKDAEVLLRKYYGEGRLSAWIAWLDDPRRKSMAALEAQAQDAGRQPLSASRKRLLERLEEAAGSTEAALDAQQAVSRALLFAVEPGVPASRRLTPARMNDVLRELKIRMEPSLREMALVSAAQAYRKAGDKQLEDFVALHESRTGKWVRGAARELRNAVLARAVLRAKSAVAGAHDRGTLSPVGERGKE